MASGAGGISLRSGNARFVASHGGKQRSSMMADTGTPTCGHFLLPGGTTCSVPQNAGNPGLSSAAADLLPHGQSEEELELRDEERRAAEELAAKYRAAAADVGNLATGLLAEAGAGEESVAIWMRRRWAELGVR